MAKNSIDLPSGYIVLNVGGVVYETTRSTLGRQPGLLRTMFLTDLELLAWQGCRYVMDAKDLPFLDRDGPAFAAVLAYLRTGVALVPPQVSLFAAQRELAYYFPGPQCPLACSDAMARVIESPQFCSLLDKTQDDRLRVYKTRYALETIAFSSPIFCASSCMRDKDGTHGIFSVMLGCLKCSCYVQDCIQALLRHDETRRALQHYFFADDVTVVPGLPDGAVYQLHYFNRPERS